MKNNETSEYYVSHFNGPHGPGGPNGALYGKMVADLKQIQSTVSAWQAEEKSSKSEGDALLSCSEVLEKLGKIELGVSHWHDREKDDEYARSQWEWQDRQDEFESIELNLRRAGRGMLLAKAILATNQDALWATLFLLHVYRDKYAAHLLEECVDSVTAIPPVIRKCFAQLGFQDEGSVREAMRQQ